MSLDMQVFSISFNVETWFLLLWYCQDFALYSCLLCSVFLWRREGGCGLIYIPLNLNLWGAKLNIIFLQRLL